MSVNCLAILGPGLLGGSVAMAAVARAVAGKVALWARSEARAREVRESGLHAEVGTDLDGVLADADLVVLATPVGAMPELARRIAAGGRLAPGAVVTDVGSVKGLVDSEVRPILQGAGIDFIGSHPMAGSERTGWQHARADLFEGAVCVVTPAEGIASAASAAVENFWSALGCRLFRMPPAAHDRAVARISHLPHVAAAALVLAALEEDASVAELTGNGFRDSSRVASGSPQMWTEILIENRAEVAVVLRRLGGRIGEVLEFLEDMDEENLRRFLERAKELRDASLHHR
jgi:prephenate dehydrogenase